MKTAKYPSIYEINTRVWIKQFGENASLKNIPNNYWHTLKQKGIDLVWLMGIWSVNKESISKYCFEEGLVYEYKKALKDFKNEDVIGSPYAIEEYEIEPVLGNREDVLKLKEELNQIGIGLILDFIPNHFNALSKIIRENPEIFLIANHEFHLSNPYTFFKPLENELIIAHGRDPFYPAWQDTAQVNYFSESARAFMISQLESISELCDGVRCDMAMLALNNIFKNTWASVIESGNYEFPKDEFWQRAILKIKEKNNDFIFIAEAYWDLEWKLQQLGFDFTYDKELLDRIRSAKAIDIKGHLTAEDDYQDKSLRFIENHDEPRSLTVLGKDKVIAASIIYTTVKGMKFFNDGQFEGKKIKLPVQLGRMPIEKPCEQIVIHYKSLMQIISADIFKNGEWNLLEPLSSWEGNYTFENILAWHWNYKNENRLVVINYSDKISTCRIKLDLTGYNSEFELIDLLNQKTYVRSSEEIHHQGLYIELKAYKSHIFSY